MGKFINYLKRRWVETRVAQGYFLWIGVPVMYMFMKILGWNPSLIQVGVFHLIGLFLVAKYDWFVLSKKKVTK